jgi:hypothetical protein
MKKIFLITLLSFFISSISYSQTNDFLRLKCISEEKFENKSAYLYYELDFKKSKYILKAHVFDNEIVKSNKNLFVNKKHFPNDVLHLDEENFKIDEITFTTGHLIFLDKLNILILEMEFTEGVQKPTGGSTFKVNCEKITSFPNLTLSEKEKNDNRKIFTLKNCYYTPQQKSFDKNRFDQLDVEVDRTKKKVNLKVILSDNELKKNKELSEKYKKNISIIYNIDSDKNNIIKASTMRDNKKESLEINVNKLEINEGKNRLICE